MANTDTTTKKDEIKELKAQLKEQKKQIDQLVAALNSKIESEVKPVNNDRDDINSEEEILVISLVPNKLNLLNKQGEVMRSFNGMYDEQFVDYDILKECVNSHRDMALNGRYYIADERVVSKLRLKHAYNSILSPNQFKDIIDNNVNTAAELYKMAPTGQKKVIIDIIKEKRMKGVDMDMNMLYKLKEASGVDLVDVEDVMSIKIK